MQQLAQDSDSNLSTQTVARSFDSSLIYSYPSYTQSLQSLSQTKVSNPLSVDIGTTYINPQMSINQIQNTRLESVTPSNFSQDFSFHSVGFVVGKQKKPIQIDLNRLKKVKNFFDDTPPQSQQENQQQNNTIGFFPIVKQQKIQSQQFSVPCFKTGGINGFNVNINKQFLSKAKNFFNQQFELSAKKPTKLKKNEQKQFQKDFVKTANFKTKSFDIACKKIQKPKKQTFDWDQYQKNIKNIYENQKQVIVMQRQRYFTTLRIKDVNIQTVKQSQKIQQFKQRSQNMLMEYVHYKKNCQIIGCLLCKLDWKDGIINIQNLYEIFTKKLTVYNFSYQSFLQIYRQVHDKLLKYEIFHPQISNKKLNPSVLLYQIFKKQQKINRQKYNGWIHYVLSQNNHFTSFICYVKKIQYFQKMEIYFIQLSDGWSSVWAVIQKANPLHAHIQKIKLCAKLFVSYWSFYPLSNILTYCKSANSNQKGIEIYYNSTIMMNQNVKIGKSQFLFYRPLHKCRNNGGIIPTVQGTIVRMFYLKQNKKQLKAISMRQNYLQILTPEGYTVLIRFILSQQNTLAQLFRLYYTYQFYYLKIANQNQLCFTLPHSKFFELSYDKNKPYSNNLILLLKKRYLNLMSSQQLRQLKVGDCYDFKIQDNQTNYHRQNYKINIEDENQGKNITLYQQLVLSFKDDDNKLISLKKYKFSNTLKTLPKIYKLLYQDQ